MCCLRLLSLHGFSDCRCKHTKHQTLRGFMVCRKGSAASCIVWYPMVQKRSWGGSVIADVGGLLYGHCGWWWWLLCLLCQMCFSHPKRLALVLQRAARLRGLCLQHLGVLPTSAVLKPPFPGSGEVENAVITKLISWDCYWQSNWAILLWLIRPDVQDTFNKLQNNWDDLIANLKRMDK